jgi:hypothetical protein
MIGRDERQIWRDVVRLTDECDSEVIRSVRIPILFSLWATENASFRRQAYRLFLSSGAVLPKRKVRLPEAKKGKLVFFFADNALLIMRHLLPVVLEADRRGTLGGIVSLVDLPKIKEFEGRVPMVTVNSLESHLNWKEKIGIAKESARIFNDISGILGRCDAFYASRFRNSAGEMLGYIATSLSAAKAFKILFDAWQPSCVMTPSDAWPVHYQFSHQASAAGIPSVAIQHGTTGFFCWPFASDLACVWGEIFAEEMRNFGVPQERMAVVGLPSTDKIFQHTKSSQYWQERNRPKPVCLFLSQTHGAVLEPAAFAAYRQLVIELTQRMPSIEWKVKLHPMENDTFYREMGTEVFNRLSFLPKQTSLEDAVDEADFVTTATSTAGLEAMMMDRPLIVAPATPRIRELGWWPAAGGGIYADSAEDFQRKLTKLVSDRNHWVRQLELQHAFLAKSFANQGHATESVVDLLESYPASRFPRSKKSAQHDDGVVLHSQGNGLD